jgi:hypothetical protein
VPLSATVTVPGEPDFLLSSHTSRGSAFCCAAEAMLLGLHPEQTGDLGLVGAIDPRSVETLDRLGKQDGFYREVGQGGFSQQVVS